LTVADAKAGIEMNRSFLESEVIAEKTYWAAPSGAPPTRMKNPTIHLLPNYDEYLIAYRDHSASLDASLSISSPFVYDMLSRHIIVLNGRVTGGWRSTTKKGEVSIALNLPVSLSGPPKEALHAAAERYGRFLGMTVTVDRQ
jgi:DNA glycosylase AlkZ-like